jgi:predicted nucleic acid-binding protein
LKICDAWASDLRVVVADTGPLHYLVLIDQIHLLPALLQTITAPDSVHAELLHPAAPDTVRRWAASPPAWLKLLPAPPPTGTLTASLDQGEADALNLAMSLHAELVLMDDRAGVSVARAMGLTVVGTLGILDLAASRGLVDITDAVARLKETNFRYRPGLLDALVARHHPNS